MLLIYLRMLLIYILLLKWYRIGRVKNRKVKKYRVKNLNSGKEWQGILIKR
jgi:hypothetical protein